MAVISPFQPCLYVQATYKTCSCRKCFQSGARSGFHSENFCPLLPSASDIHLLLDATGQTSPGVDFNFLRLHLITTTVRNRLLMTVSLRSDSREPKSTYIVGINVTHTIAPPMHDHIAQKVLNLQWKFKPQECSTVDEAMTLFRQSDFAGGVVTMPYKKSIMPKLDELDDLCKVIGACNCIYLAESSTKQKILRGTNTDWRGIKGCLSSADKSSIGYCKPALIIGAGGASRAAVYALFVELQCSPIYVINRDVQEVSDLVSDVQGMTSPTAKSKPEIIHVKTPARATALASPHYIVGTVPDFEPSTPDEINARETFTAFLEEAEPKGIFLDMCFKPRVTRQIQLAKSKGWTTVEGTGIIGHQIQEQYRLWAGADLSEEDQESAWKVLREKAESSPGINF